MLAFTTSLRTPETMVSVLVASGRTVEVAVFVFIASSFWKRKVNDGHHSDSRTHIKDPKHIVEVQPPGGDRLLILLRVETPRNRVLFAPLDQLPLNICHRPAIEIILVGDSRCISLVPLTPPMHLSYRTRADQGRLIFFHSHPGQAPDKYRHKIFRARHSPVHQPLSPC